MYKDGRFANLQRRRESTEDGEWLRRHLLGLISVMCTRTQFHVIDLVPSRTRSQPGLARHVRAYVRTYAEKAVHIIKCGARSGSPQLYRD